MKKLHIILFTALSLFISGCSADNATTQTELTISAAASLREVMEETGQLYMKQNPGIKIVYNFGGSGSLQQQISQGAPVDLFISAAEDKFDYLYSKKLLHQEHSVRLLKNELVLITQKTSKGITSAESLTADNIKRIAIGTPESVPAGMYGKQALISLQLWDDLEQKIIPTKDVRQVLSYVETENVDAGIVYKTDALISDKVRIIPLEGKELHDPIVYPVGVVAATKHLNESVDFFNFLKRQEAMEIFKKYGFKAALE
ncbi:molybdate ABC transporter substrate-binding protein [Mesobacillus jeotgali]|uniref:Molybdate ABC transporter substrate-binding protein n=1 Tax=Mesobacillus jeotgali TaxID=129985 RepID=A0ABY9VCB1_9BACI|nr:molybdate ABC transporter substrate-binding protein [Mesobacillus jeotgali]WNF21258.1 molybdate ABC transporter substrate-binding protein [Mesobacillus jeotgali]